MSTQASSNQSGNNSQLKPQTIVVKLGTSVLTGGTLEINKARMVDSCSSMR